LYHYRVNVFDGTTGATLWYLDYLPSTATSIGYGTGGSVYQSTLTAGTQYYMVVTVVDEANNDTGEQYVLYTP
jgi:hypothetical protein